VSEIVRDGMRQQTTLGPADDPLDPDGVLAVKHRPIPKKNKPAAAAAIPPCRGTGAQPKREHPDVRPTNLS